MFLHTRMKKNIWVDLIFLARPCYWAHLCLCMVGSYASLSVCPSVIWPKFRLENNSYLKKYSALWARSLMPIKVYDTSRWAHFNVKLHFFFHNKLRKNSNDTSCLVMWQFYFVLLTGFLWNSSERIFFSYALQSLAQWSMAVAQTWKKERRNLK